MDALASPRRRSLLLALGAGTLAAGCGTRVPSGSTAARSWEFAGPTMGTSYTVKIAGAALRGADRALASRVVHRAFSDVMGTMSVFDRGSEIARLNRHAAGSPFALSADTFRVLALARDVSAASGGAFDVTVAPVVEAWGFGPGRLHRVPAGDEIRALEARVGWRLISLDPGTRTASKARADVQADLCGIAKGFAVDQAAHALHALGIEHYMVEAGGEVRVRGLNADGVPWRIGIEQPDSLPRAARLVVPLRDLSMATSGDYRIYFERDGRRHCHEIDPANALTIANGLASVSVVADGCAFADAMATALMVMGPREGPAFCAARGIAAHFIVREPGGGLADVATPAFAALTRS